MTVSAELQRLVIRRAADRCEYCRMHQSLQGATFHIEHIVPKSGGGQSDADNLALACPGCNLHKSDRIEAVDPVTTQSAPLFHPRRDQWSEHFRWDGFEIIGLTATGRATVATFDLNHDRLLRIRQAESLFGMFPEGS